MPKTLSAARLALFILTDLVMETAAYWRGQPGQAAR
jgi:hypothetical protein